MINKELIHWMCTSATFKISLINDALTETAWQTPVISFQLSDRTCIWLCMCSKGYLHYAKQNYCVQSGTVTNVIITATRHCILTVSPSCNKILTVWNKLLSCYAFNTMLIYQRGALITKNQYTIINVKLYIFYYTEKKSNF